MPARNPIFPSTAVRELRARVAGLEAAHLAQRQTTEQLEAARAALTAFVSGQPPELVFRILLDALVGLSGSRFGFLDELARAGQGCVYKRTLALSNIAWDDSSRREYSERAAARYESVRLENLQGASIVTGEVVIANAPGQDSRAGGLPSGHPALESYLGLPLSFGGEQVGMAGLANRPGGYDASIAAALEPLASTSAALIHALVVQERAQALADEVEAGEGRWRSLVESLPGTVYRCMAEPPYVLVYISPEIQALSGCPSTHFLDGSGRGFSELVAPRDWPRVSRAILRAIQGHGTYEIQHRVPRGAREAQRVLDRGSVLCNSQGAPQWIEGILLPRGP